MQNCPRMRQRLSNMRLLAKYLRCRYDSYETATFASSNITFCLIPVTHRHGNRLNIFASLVDIVGVRLSHLGPKGPQQQHHGHPSGGPEYVGDPILDIWCAAKWSLREFLEASIHQDADHDQYDFEQARFATNPTTKRSTNLLNPSRHKSGTACQQQQTLVR